MKLRTRQMKPGFWTDARLQLWSMGKRLFYQGLMQIADDSGCLLRILRDFKALLFPADAAITLQVLDGWLAEMQTDGLLIPYLKEGFAYLFLTEFAARQAGRRAAPQAPLPDWVEFVPSPTQRGRGKYYIASPYEPAVKPITPVIEKPAVLVPVAVAPASAAASPPPAPAYPELFEKFWEVYPRKEGKEAAYARWRTIAFAANPAERYNGLNLYNLARYYDMYCREVKAHPARIMPPVDFLCPKRQVYVEFLDYPRILLHIAIAKRNGTRPTIGLRE